MKFLKLRILRSLLSGSLSKVPIAYAKKSQLLGVLLELGIGVRKGLQVSMKSSKGLCRASGFFPYALNPKLEP